jgi:hypothetical protein
VIPLLERCTYLWRRWAASCSAPAVDDLPDDPRTRRERLFDELAQLERGFAAEVADRQEQAATIQDEIRQAEAGLAVLRARLSEVEHKNIERSMAVGRRADGLRAAIAELAPRALDTFLAQLASELERLRRIEPEIRPDGSDRDYALMKKSPRFLSNATSIKRRVRALHAARARAEGLRVTRLSSADILAEITRLERTLPAVKLEEVRGRGALIMS